MQHETAASRGWLHWTRGGRALVFVLGATGLACTLAELYGMMSMRTWALCLMLPSVVALAVWAAADWINPSSDQRVFRAVVIGALGGLAAVLAADAARLPTAFPEVFGLGDHASALPMFNAIPRRGAMLLGEAATGGAFSGAALAVGWLYHVVNGAMLGVMYMALVGEPRWRNWKWALLFALCLQMVVLATPYMRVFSMELTAGFVAASLCSHAALGVALGRLTRWLAERWEPGEAWQIFAEE